MEELSRKWGTKSYWMVQPPVNEIHLEDRKKPITNNAIYKYNEEVYRRFKGSSEIILWTSFRGLVDGTLDKMSDGIHADPLALTQGTQMILNFHCNDNMNFNDGSCCKSSDKPTGLQIITFALFGFGYVNNYIKCSVYLLVNDFTNNSIIGRCRFASFIYITNIALENLGFWNPTIIHNN